MGLCFVLFFVVTMLASYVLQDSLMLQQGKASFDGAVFTIAESFQVATTVCV